MKTKYTCRKYHSKQEKKCCGKKKKERKTSKFFFCPQKRPLRAALRRSIITVKSRSECFPKKEVVFEERVASCGKNLGLMCGRMNKEVAILEKRIMGQRKTQREKCHSKFHTPKTGKAVPGNPLNSKCVERVASALKCLEGFQKDAVAKFLLPKKKKILKELEASPFCKEI